jgi:hypothetical protein
MHEHQRPRSCLLKDAVRGRFATQQDGLNVYEMARTTALNTVLCRDFPRHFLRYVNLAPFP